ncbi:PEP-CTERM sorting domain-containing protein [Massilia yuzhufengensis]|uniref:PEP-CTERM protein-sorting domain-containing protein/MYXO-CTERM domain-containing protein n=1 Tax=Massilia yuzhufengensis TaxID=1164594 RepID=A0A1I1LBN1_9BURK|nr:PEP-CTERM sorting domain-containing protein [Massilia yuzhufengensis]SFC70396.1 PEP-CTERM protein-sorting domain-containing protein/MYXO-CTERM domain-containing protein [Massilia yuzhufengensis]
MFKKLFPALLLAAAANANATVIDYTMAVSAAMIPASGQFTGVDNNADGFLSQDELSALSFTIPSVNYHFTLADVTNFGRYDIALNTWLNEALNNNQKAIAWVTFMDGRLEASTLTVSNVVTRVAPAAVPADVPEPASMALAALGLVALGATRRRKK